MVTVIFPKTLAIRTGEMHKAPIGFFAAAISLITLSTSGLTVQSILSKAKEQRFFATPKPPGKTIASKSSLLNTLNGFIFPLAILADSIKTLRVSSISSPVM